MRISRRQWALAIAAALAIHVGVTIAVLWRPSSPGAAAAGMGGIAVALGPAGSAPGAIAGAGAEAEEVLDNDDPEAGENPVQADDPVVEAEADRSQSTTAEPEPADAVDAAATPEPPPAPAPVADRVPAPEPQVVAAAPRPKPSPPLAARSQPRSPAPSASRLRADASADAGTARSTHDETRRGDLAGAGGPAGTVARSDAGAASAAEGGGTPGATADYMAALRAWLERHKRYPRTAQLRRQEGVAVLSFVIDREGRVLTHRLQQSSGHPALDREVEALIHRAQPLPPPPATMAQARLEVVVPIRFALDG
ncbi:MAG: energy transducer TonB [Rhodospirillales bacterium]|nr:MAG: energy transducer TonB [Rhodospirillales bacterium]